MKTSLAFKIANFARKQGLKFDALHDPRVIAMREEIAQLKDDGINFSINIYNDGTWSARSTNVDGIITGGDNFAESNEMIKDAIFTYYDVPPQFCEDRLLHGSGEKKTIHNEILVTA